MTTSSPGTDASPDANPGAGNNVTPTDSEKMCIGRPAAGENPLKRDQILNGALNVFFAKGFERASMNDIAKEAGVSKGTLYVYFKSKDDLFIALTRRKWAQFVDLFQKTLDEPGPLDRVLLQFGIEFATLLTTKEAVRRIRMMIGVIGNLPSAVQNFMRTDSQKSGAALLKTYLDKQVALGTVKIDDTSLAAHQFVELCLAGHFRENLYAIRETQLPPDEIKKIVSSAVAMFLKFYAVS